MNVSDSLSEASKLFHSLIADGMQDLLNVVVVVGILEILLLFLNSYLDTFETVGGIRSEMYEGTKPFTALYINFIF